MDKNDINQIVDELERRGYAPKQYPPKEKNSSNGLIFLFAIAIMVLGLWTIINEPSPTIQGQQPPVVISKPTQPYIITESEVTIVATSDAPIYEPVPTVNRVAPMLQATLAGEWPRPITPEQYDQCVANPDVNPVCADYLGKN